MPYKCLDDAIAGAVDDNEQEQDLDDVAAGGESELSRGARLAICGNPSTNASVVFDVIQSGRTDPQAGRRETMFSDGASSAHRISLKIDQRDLYYPAHHRWGAHVKGSRQVVASRPFGDVLSARFQCSAVRPMARSVRQTRCHALGRRRLRENDRYNVIVSIFHGTNSGICKLLHPIQRRPEDQIPLY